MRYELVQTLTSEFAVETLYLVLGVTGPPGGRTACYRYLRGVSYQLSPENAEYQQVMKQVFPEHKRRYRSRRITVELQEKWHLIGRYKVRTLMGKADLQAIQPHWRPSQIVHAKND